jgi:hypothetical protein
MSLWPVRPWKIADPDAADAIGVGAFNMIRTEAYLRLGGFEAAPMEVLEDLMLGRRIKLAKMRQRVATAPGLLSVHWAPRMAGIVRGMTKNIFAVFRYRSQALLAAVLGIAALCMGPVICLAIPGAWPASCVALGAVLGLYTLSFRTSRISPLYGFGLPVAAAITIYAMLRSMALTLHRGGIIWRDTFYSLAELREHDAQMRARDMAIAHAFIHQG